MLLKRPSTMTERENADAAMDHLTRTTPPMDLTVAAGLLCEAKEVFDGLGVAFFLRQGTCLGAIRDAAFIPWDDDIDIGSIVGMHGFNEDSIEPVADAFRARGFHVRRDQFDGEIWLGIMKDNIRIDWLCLRIRQGHVLHFPGVRLPIRLFENLKEINFIETQFLVPDPPEEYLAIKYGANWITPNRLDYGGEVIRNMPDGPSPGHPGRLKQRLLARLPGRSTRLWVLDRDAVPIPGVKITIAGWGAYSTNKEGYARFYLPQDDTFALIIEGKHQEEVLYEEQMAPGKTYVYRPDAEVSSGRIFILTAE
jgi:hypothetical protein